MNFHRCRSENTFVYFINILTNLEVRKKREEKYQNKYGGIPIPVIFYLQKSFMFGAYVPSDLFKVIT